MAKDGLLQVRIDPAEKSAAEDLFNSMGTTLSEAVRIFITQSLIQQRLPFTVSSPHRHVKGKAYGILNLYARPSLRDKERDVWIQSLSSKSGETASGGSEPAPNYDGDQAYRHTRD